MIKLILVMLGRYIAKYWGGSDHFINTAGRFKETNENVIYHNKKIVAFVDQVRKDQRYDYETIELLRKSRKNIDRIVMDSDMKHFNLVRQRYFAMIAFGLFDWIYKKRYPKHYKDFNKLDESNITKENFNHYSYEQALYLNYISYAMERTKPCKVCMRMDTK